MTTKNFNAKKVLMSTIAAVVFSFVFTTSAMAEVSASTKSNVGVRVKTEQKRNVGIRVKTSTLYQKHAGSGTLCNYTSLAPCIC